MRILGVSAFSHEAAAAVVEDGVVKAAIENDKIVRSRTQGLPEAAIRACFEKAGTRWSDLDLVAVATRPLKGFARKSLLRAKLAAVAPVVSGYYEAKEIGLLARRLGDHRTLRKHAGQAQGKDQNKDQNSKDQNQNQKKVVSFDHDLCHAANAFFLSPFERALIIVMDEDGDGNSTLVAAGEGNSIRPIATTTFPDSLAWIYSLVTAMIGFTPHQEEHKTQWLGLEGQPIYKDVFLEMLGQAKLSNSRSPLPRLNYKFFNRGLAGKLAFSGEFYRRIGLTENNMELSEEQRRALASSIQQACTEIIARLVRHYQKTLNQKNPGEVPVCLSGALFTNSLLVAALEEQFGIDRIFVPPAPGNPGSAVGAALWAWHHEMQKPRGEAVVSVFWGPRPSAQGVKDVLDNCKLRYAQQITEQRKIDTAAQLLESGKVVGWYQGAAEFGPRALGNRSVLASPWAPYVKENLNDFIKQREWFRPFAVAVPEEDCARYFVASGLCRFMNSLARVKADVNPLPPDFCLPGGLIRLHVVERSSSPLFWKLLKSFGEHAPAPMLLNTSFNLFGEPLVVSTRDALRSYFCSGVDALVIENFLLSKTSLSSLLGSVSKSSPVTVTSNVTGR
jgi:carbamoyltransferase